MQKNIQYLKEGGLKKWFDQKWVDIGSKKKGGGFRECGRKSASGSKRRYPKCVPAAKAARMTDSQKRSAVARKSKTGSRRKANQCKNICINYKNSYSHPMRDVILKALEDKYNADISEAEANLKVYLENPVGVAEHPDVVAEADKLVAKIAEAEDKLGILKEFNDWRR